MVQALLQPDKDIPCERQKGLIISRAKRRYTGKASPFCGVSSDSSLAQLPPTLTTTTIAITTTNTMLSNRTIFRLQTALSKSTTSTLTSTRALPFHNHHNLLRLLRPLSTSTAHAHPVANQTAYPDLLQRDPDRDLPTLSSLSSRRRWLTTLPIFIAILTASALGIFNYQKVNSPIITATMYALRTNNVVREALGDEVYFASKWAWIWGQINLVQGKVDVSFRVKGTREKGVCRFVAKRLGGKGGSVGFFFFPLCFFSSFSPSPP